MKAEYGCKTSVVIIFATRDELLTRRSRSHLKNAGPGHVDNTYCIVRQVGHAHMSDDQKPVN